MTVGYKYFWVTYEDAQRMMELVDYARKNSGLEPDVRERLAKIRTELSRVRDIEYKGTPGAQIVLTEGDAKIYVKLYDLYEQGIIME